MTRRFAWPAIACASATVLALVVLAGVGGPVRLVLTIWFMGVTVGMSIVPALDIPSPQVELLVGVATSIVLDTLIATALAALGVLTLTSATISLGAVCLLGAAINLTREPREPRRT